MPIIRCPIHGSILLNQRELALVDTPFFQRLRRISQLGFISYVFPGAVHTRFSHSLGTFHLAGRIFDQLSTEISPLRRYYTSDQLAYFKQILKFSALLHDIGHPPFSHVAENLLPDLSTLQKPHYLDSGEKRKATHEDYSYSIIFRIAETEKLITQEEAYDIISVLSKKIPPSHRMNSQTGTPLIFPLLCQLINGEIDVDRMDYLLRDSYHIGVPYGKFDMDRLVGSLSCHLEERLGQFLLAIDGEAVPSYEIFLLSRVHMFSQIYFHKTLGAYTHYLNKVFEEKEIPVQIDGAMENFLELSESCILEEIRKAQSKKWSGLIHKRIPAKNLLRITNSDPKKINRLKTINHLLKENGLHPFTSISSNKYSSQIKEMPINPDTILVKEKEFGRQMITTLAKSSNLLSDKAKRIETHQLYVAREEYDDAIQIIHKNVPDNKSLH